MLMPRGNRSAGFTLVEVIITLVIFAVLAALTIPLLKTWIADVKVRSVSDALQNGLRQAQSEALRRSRQVVFSLTNSTSPQTLNGLSAVANGSFWATYTIPAMTDGTEVAQFIASGELGNTSSNVTITGPSAVCFNSLGRLVNNTSTGVTGATCAMPTTGTPPATVFSVTQSSADRPLQVNVALGGQVHLCDPNVTLSSNNPQGC